MTTTEPLAGFRVNTYEVAVPLDLSVFDSVEQAKLALVDAVAESIVAQVSELDADDASYVSTQVSFDEDEFDAVYADDDVGIATIQTRTELAHTEDNE